MEDLGRPLPPAHRLLQRMVAVEAGETRGLLLAATYFFLLLASYYVLRPVRDALGIERGEQALKWLFLATLAVTLLAVPAYAWLAGRLPRARLLAIVYHLAALCCAGFAALLWLLPQGTARVRTGYVFFVWLSVYNLFGLSAVFWAFMADVYTPGQGKRLFGFIAAGGTLGAVVGSAVASVVAPFGVPVVLFVGAAGIELAVLCLRWLARVHRPVDPKGASGARVGSVAQAWRGARQVVRSPYLAAIAAFMLLDVLTSTYLYAAQGRLAHALLPGAAERTAFFAKVDLGANALVLALEVFVVGQAMRRVGLALVLGVLPVVSLGALATLAAWPTLVALGVVQVLRRGVEFGLAKPAREVLFTVVSRQEKYDAKAFIDTAVNRATDVALLWLLAGLPRTAPAAALWVAAPLALVWVWLSWWTARSFRRRSAGSPADG